MKRLLAILVVLALLPTATVLADDQVCTTIGIEWTDIQPTITDIHYADTGVRVAVVGGYLWTQYGTTDDPSEGGAILSTKIGRDVIAIEACPDGLVTLTESVPVESEVAEPVEPDVVEETDVVIDVIDYWAERGYDLYPE